MTRIGTLKPAPRGREQTMCVVLDLAVLSMQTRMFIKTLCVYACVNVRVCKCNCVRLHRDGIGEHAALDDYFDVSTCGATLGFIAPIRGDDAGAAACECVCLWSCVCVCLCLCMCVCLFASNVFLCVSVYVPRVRVGVCEGACLCASYGHHIRGLWQ